MYDTKKLKKIKEASVAWAEKTQDFLDKRPERKETLLIVVRPQRTTDI
jgi:hypothetical protein